MDVLVISNRPATGAGFADGCVPGPVTWAEARCTAAPHAPEGWAWSYGGGAGLARLGRDAFLAGLAARLQPDATPKALLLHVHGAGCLGADMVCRAANLARTFGGPDLEIVPVIVSWACGGFTPQDYVDARRWIARDVGALADAFRAIAAAAAARAPGVRAFVTAHSLGNHLLSRILADCAARGAEPAGPAAPFDGALLFAADVDSDALDEAAPKPGAGLHRLDRWARAIHVHFSPADAVLGLGLLGQAAQPIPGRSGTALGNSGPLPDLTRTPGGVPVHAVDCGRLPAALAGDTQHHYWRVDPLAVEDVRAVLRGVPPERMPWRRRELFRPTWTIAPTDLPGAG